MPKHDIVVIGGSAGALEALNRIVELLPPTLEACVLIVIHLSAESNGALPEILSRRAQLPVAFATDGSPLEHGRIYVARPDRHLVVSDGVLRVLHGPRENGFRPAVDPLFRTAAREFGPRVTGVIVSGALSDGTYGLSVIKQHGGVAIVQDPADAVITSMPKSAIALVNVDYVLPAGEIAAAIERLTQESGQRGDEEMARTDDFEPQLPSEETSVARMEQRFGSASSLTCPDCGGALWEVDERRLVRYQCHTGHQYAPDVLDVEQRGAVESALWSAVRVLEEHADLKTRMARRAEASGLTVVSEGFAEGARDAHEHAQQIRTVLFANGAAAKPAVHANTRVPRGRRKIGRTKRRD